VVVFGRGVALLGDGIDAGAVFDVTDGSATDAVVLVDMGFLRELLRSHNPCGSGA